MKKLIFLLCLGFILHSCTKEPQIENEIGNMEETTISFGLKLSSSSVPTTRTGGAVAKDMKIEDITILVFDESSICLYGRTGKITQSSSSDAKFTANLIASESKVTIHVFANVKGGVSLTNYKDRLESEVIKELTTTIDLNDAMTTALPMHGKLSLAKVDNSTNSGHSVSLLRSVASVDVVVAATNFTLQEITAYFSPNEGRLVHDVANWDSAGNGEVTKPTMPKNPIITTKTITAKSVVDNAIKNQLFIYENLNVTGTGKSTRVVVKGEYNDGTVTKSYWYPVDFVETEVSTLSNVLRNFRYTFNIMSVTGAGYDNEEDASVGSSQNLKVTVIPWSEESIGNIIFDGENYFSIESQSVKIYGNANERKYIKVKSNIDVSKWEMRWGESGDYVTSQEITTTNFSVRKPNAGSNSGYLLFTTLTSCTEDKTDNLHIIVAKRLKISIKILQSVENIILKVDGKTGTIDTPTIRYDGGVSEEFEVVTGDDMVLWHAKLSEENAYMKFPTAGVNYGSFRVVFNPYLEVTDIPHKAVITLTRDDGVADPVTLNFTQESQPDFSVEELITLKAGDVARQSSVIIPFGSHKKDYEWTATLSGIDLNGEEILRVSNDGNSWHKSVSGVALNKFYVKAPKRISDGSKYTVKLTVNFNRKGSPIIVHSTAQDVVVTSDWIYKIGGLYPYDAIVGSEQGLVISTYPLRILERQRRYGTFDAAITTCGAVNGRLPNEVELKALSATDCPEESIHIAYGFTGFQHIYGETNTPYYAYKFTADHKLYVSLSYWPENPTQLAFRCSRTIVE